MTEPTGKTYVVEHMEPEMGAWSTLEYITIARETRASNSRFYLSSMHPTLARSLPPTLAPLVDNTHFLITTADVESLPHISRARVCLLDPQAAEDLTPADAAEFDVFVFGGILGDHPPRDRTAELRRYGFAGRRLGGLQMTTDTAVRVTRLVVEGGRRFEEIAFVDYPEIRISRNEATEMPFRYVRGEDGEPVMPEGMLELIKKDADKNLEDLF